MWLLNWYDVKNTSNLNDRGPLGQRLDEAMQYGHSSLWHHFGPHNPPPLVPWLGMSCLCPLHEQCIEFPKFTLNYHRKKPQLSPQKALNVSNLKHSFARAVFEPVYIRGREVFILIMTWSISLSKEYKYKYTQEYEPVQFGVAHEI